RSRSGRIWPTYERLDHALGGHPAGSLHEDRVAVLHTGDGLVRRLGGVLRGDRFDESLRPRALDHARGEAAAADRDGDPRRGEDVAERLVLLLGERPELLHLAEDRDAPPRPGDL